MSRKRKLLYSLAFFVGTMVFLLASLGAIALLTMGGQLAAGYVAGILGLGATVELVINLVIVMALPAAVFTYFYHYYNH